MQLISTRKCMTRDVAFNGNLFGGQLLSWLDEAAVAYACQTCETPRMVTVYISEVHFKKPVRPGQIIKIYGEVKETNISSIDLNIEARRHSTYNNTEKTICTTVMRFVRIDGDGEPVPISEHIRERYRNIRNDNQKTS
ncbi:MAG: acyl-CoA thioesterase [Parcubacteria group bacterium]|nr:acyl-CoA thioesterase [Parcubacteria group bacterium]